MTLHILVYKCSWWINVILLNFSFFLKHINKKITFLVMFCSKSQLKLKHVSIIFNIQFVNKTNKNLWSNKKLFTYLLQILFVSPLLRTGNWRNFTRFRTKERRNYHKNKQHQSQPFRCWAKVGLYKTTLNKQVNSWNYRLVWDRIMERIWILSRT